MFESRYDHRIRTVQTRTTALMDEAGRMLDDAVSALAAGDAPRAQSVVNHDDVVDEETFWLEEEAIELISLQQPRQKDLRVLAACLRIVRDVERIADYACDIADTVPEATGITSHPSLVEIIHLAHLTTAMLNRARTAFVQRDGALAMTLDREDDQVDEQYRAFSRSCLAHMQKDPEHLVALSQLFLIARYLERVADHIVNIGEMTLYLLNGSAHPFRIPHPGDASRD